MPGQDGTGPLGEGPRTGRGMGNCKPASYSTSGNRGAGFGRGMGRGRGFGAGNGRGRGLMNRMGNFFGFGRQPISQKQELQDYVNNLEAELNDAKEALKKIDDSKEEKNGK